MPQENPRFRARSMLGEPSGFWRIDQHVGMMVGDGPGRYDHYAEVGSIRAPGWRSGWSRVGDEIIWWPLWRACSPMRMRRTGGYVSDGGGCVQ